MNVKRKILWIVNRLVQKNVLIHPPIYALIPLLIQIVAKNLQAQIGVKTSLQTSAKIRQLQFARFHHYQSFVKILLIITIV
jgi:hypothetical protein